MEAQETTTSGRLPESPDTPLHHLFKSLRSLRRSVNTCNAEAQEPAVVSENVIPTPSEVSELSCCMVDHHTNLENDQDNYEEVVPNLEKVIERSYTRNRIVNFVVYMSILRLWNPALQPLH